MLGQPIYMLLPEVVGFELTGTLRPGVTATDMTLRIVEMLRAHGVVSKFVEFHGEKLAGRTADVETMNARSTLVADIMAKGRLVESPVLVPRRCDQSPDTFQCFCS